MTIWDRYKETQRDEYEKYISMIASLSELFNQKSTEDKAPYLDSKFQETIYAKCFESQEVDINNTPHDIMSIFDDVHIGIGLKTWKSSRPSFQKVMQIKGFMEEIEDAKKLGDEELIEHIAKIKNERLLSDYNRLGLSKDKNIYHYITRDSGKLRYYETSYPLIDMNTLEKIEKTNKRITFRDKNKTYKYTFSDSQIYMRFGPDESQTSLLCESDINLLDDPFSFLKQAFALKKNQETYDNTESVDYLYLPLYSYSKKEVLPRSGINAWNGKPKTKGSRKPRPSGEAYIPIPKDVWKKKPRWVDKNIDMSNYYQYKDSTGKSSYEFTLHLPNGEQLPAMFAQSDFKSLQTNPQSALGTWLLNALGIFEPQRTEYDKPAKKIVTMDRLKNYGVDSVKLWHKTNDPKHIWIDFAKYGSFERFMEQDEE
ncbi:MAG: NgoFVII family restriction endonuclease [Lactobacillus sp.]|nr:NgoFVII family restriction endonuclease [Lactobacillus sp.]